MHGRTHMISVRLTDAERRKLSQICAVSGLPVSAAVREMIGGVTIRQRPPQELHDLYVEINHTSMCGKRDGSTYTRHWQTQRHWLPARRSTKKGSPVWKRSLKNIWRL